MKTRIQIYLLSLAFFACNEDAPEPTVLEPFESKIFEKIGQLASVSEQFWEGFDYMHSYPAYLIILSTDDGEPHGYLLNPPEIPNGSSRVNNDFGLDLYRNDRFIEDASANLGEFGTFSFDFKIGEVDYFLLKELQSSNFYFDYKNRDNNWMPAVMLHELFHIFQLNWADATDVVYNFEGYPLTEDIIALHLLLYDVMADAYDAVTPQEIDMYLKYYVAIRQEQIRIDPSDNRILANHSDNRERIEGTARYIEYFSAQSTIFPDIGDDPTQGWRDFIDGITDELGARQALVIRTWYHTGAVVVHMLKTSGVDVENELLNGGKLLPLAADLTDLSDGELSAVLEELKMTVNYENYMQRAQEIYNSF